MTSLLNNGALMLKIAPNPGNPFESIAYFLINIVQKMTPYAYVAAGVMVVILGFMLILGGARQREQVKSHFKIIIIALLIILGAPALANFFGSQSSGAFGNQGFDQTIMPLLDFIKIKL